MCIKQECNQSITIEKKEREEQNGGTVLLSTTVVHYSIVVVKKSFVYSMTGVMYSTVRYLVQ